MVDEKNKTGAVIERIRSAKACGAHEDGKIFEKFVAYGGERPNTIPAIAFCSWCDACATIVAEAAQPQTLIADLAEVRAMADGVLAALEKVKEADTALAETLTAGPFSNIGPHRITKALSGLPGSKTGQK